ncbi:YihY/virulence factor BrkB family protein [Chitinophagaceae bacterium LB-8]|uniref:YihY/virulence factor BrkB family protein n=1 Tax=Paraflavisolibacter caeni TaxID=2982496 RepID=A0A9X3BIW1_9BACT|nr:YihY/virulence factor BrkB family protein [Paraflavisolibacter caeni]MCU7550523.1 YihY/virulence factor BrkB family protein [Paraflavisolibacter caeni]
MARISIKGIWSVLKQSFKGFGDDKVTKLSASLAYYTVFSLGPLMIVIIFLASIFFGREAIEGSIYAQMQSFVGKEAALELQQIIKNASISSKGTIAAIIGFATLLIGATSVFAEIQDSINSIWGLKPKPNKAGWLLLIKNRLLSFSVIASLGFILLVSLAVTAVIEALMKRLQMMFPDVTVIIVYVVNLVVSFTVITLLFLVIFKVLPDAKMKWKDMLAGAITTAILFMLGKFAISFYIGQSDVGSTYGAAGSLVILLLWVYYSSFILYFGAEFTLAYSKQFGGAIKPNEYAVWEKEPAVPGAKAEFEPGEIEQIERNNSPYYESYEPVRPKKKSSKPGLFTIFSGLLLYFVSSSGKK